MILINSGHERRFPPHAKGGQLQNQAESFDELCALYGPVFEESLQSAFKPCKRARCSSQKACLQSLEAKLPFILFYFKCYPAVTVLGFLFGVERRLSNRWMHRLKGFLETALGKKNGLPSRKLKSMVQFLDGLQK